MSFIEGQPHSRSSVSADPPPSKTLVSPALWLTLEVHPTQHHHPPFPLFHQNGGVSPRTSMTQLRFYPKRKHPSYCQRLSFLICKKRTRKVSTPFTSTAKCKQEMRWKSAWKDMKMAKTWITMDYLHPATLCSSTKSSYFCSHSKWPSLVLSKYSGQHIFGSPIKI